MSTASNKDMARRYFSTKFEAELSTKKSELDKWYAPGFVAHTSTGTNDLNGFLKIISNMLGAFPDYKFDVQDLVAENDKVVVRNVVTGTNNGSFMGMPPTGKKIKADGSYIFKFSDGKIAEMWVISDMLGIMTQIGAIPSPSSRK